MESDLLGQSYDCISLWLHIPGDEMDDLFYAMPLKKSTLP